MYNTNIDLNKNRKPIDETCLFMRKTLILAISVY